MPTPTAPGSPLTRTVAGVELLAVGKWAASKGDGNITADDLESMVTASKAAMVDRAPVKIGHADARFQDANGNPPETGDGNPAYGWVENLRIQGNKLVGDLVGVPAKLAEVMATAFRRRSVEIAHGTRVDGKVYRSVLTGLSLLGVTAPAVKNLEDVLALYSAALPDVTVVEVGDTPTVPPMQALSAESVGDTSTPVPDGKARTLTLSPELRTALGLTDASTPEQEADALKAAGLAAVAEAPADPAPATPQPPADPAPAEPKPAEAPAAPAEPAKAEALSSGLTVSVDAAAFADAQTRLAAAETELAAIRAGEDKRRRDDIAQTALSAGRIAPVAFAQYRALLDTDEAGTTALLSALPQVIPTSELGHAGRSTLSGAESADLEQAAARAVAAFVTSTPGV